MSEFDQPTSDAIARLRDEWSPPEGVEERMLADFHARLGDVPDGGGDAGSGSGSAGSGSVGATGHGLYVAKIILAVTGLTAGGLGGVVMAAKLMRGVEREPSPSREQPIASVASEVEPDEVEPVEVEPEPSPSEAPPIAAPTPAASSPPASRPQPRVRETAKVDLAAELALIREARAAEPEQALELLARHRREFASGSLGSEREALHAVNACKLDRLDEARTAVEQLITLDPGPLLRQRVEAACEKKIELPTTVFARGGDGSP